MGKESLEIALIKYNKKTWCKSALLGFLIGMAIIVPGVSGSTVAIIFKLYDQFLYALGNLFRKFAICFVFLLPIVIGLVIGIGLGFIAIKEVIDLLPFAVTCLFAGLMAGAFPAVKDEMKGAKWTPLRIALFCAGILIPVALGAVSAILTEGDADAFIKIDFWHIILAVCIGIFMGLTQIVPGLSASALLMGVGWFSSLLSNASFGYIAESPEMLLIYGAIIIGFIIGILGFSKMLTKLFARARYSSYSAIVGLSLGSILSMFCNGDTMNVYISWAEGSAKNPILDICLGVVLFIIGIIGAYWLVRYQRKKDAEKKLSAPIINE